MQKMDAVFQTPPVRTYSRAGKKQKPKQNNKTNISSIGKGLTAQESLVKEQINPDGPVESIPKPNQPSTSAKQKKKGKIPNNSAKQTRAAPKPPACQGRLKKGGQDPRKPAVIGQPKIKRMTKKKVKSLPKENMPPNEKVRDWLEKSSEYLSDEFPSLEIMREPSHAYPSEDMTREQSQESPIKAMREQSPNTPSNDMRREKSHENPSKGIIKRQSHENPSKEIRDTSHKNPSKEMRDKSHENPSKEIRDTSHENPSKEMRDKSHEIPSKEIRDTSHENPSKEMRDKSHENPSKKIKDTSHENPSKEMRDKSHENPSKEMRDKSHENPSKEMRDKSHENPSNKSHGNPSKEMRDKSHENPSNKSHGNPSKEMRDKSHVNPSKEMRDKSHVNPSKEMRDKSHEYPSNKSHENPSNKSHGNPSKEMRDKSHEYPSNKSHENRSKDMRKEQSHENSSKELLRVQSHEYPSKGIMKKQSRENPSKGIINKQSHDYPSKEIMRELSHEYPSKEMMRELSHEYPSKEIMRELSHEYPSKETMRELSHEYPSKEIMRGEEHISGERRKRLLFLGHEFESLCEGELQKSNPEDDQITELRKKDFFAQLRVQPPAVLRSRRRRDDTPIASDLLLSHGSAGESVPIDSSLYISDLPTAGKSSGQDTQTDSNQYTTADTGAYTEDITSGYPEFSIEGTTHTATKLFLEPTPEQASSHKDFEKRQKYLSSTARFDALETPKFPTDMSAIKTSGSTGLKRKAEKTPQKLTGFKVPESPSKHKKKGQRRGNLEPKNSTKLFTTGFMEIADVFPQMSTIRPDSAEPIKTFVSSPVGPDRISDDLEMDQDNRQGPCCIKTSTPNKGTDKEELQFFKFDISSVDADSGDEMLHLNKSSREINSEEIIHLSDIMVDPDQDPLSRQMERQKAVSASAHVPDTTENTKSKSLTATLLPGSVTQSIVTEQTHNSQPVAKVLPFTHQNPERDLACKKYVKERKIPKQPIRKIRSKGISKNKVSRKRGKVAFPKLPVNLPVNYTAKENDRKGDHCWFKGFSPQIVRSRSGAFDAEPQTELQDDGLIEVDALTQTFTCPVLNFLRWQCIEENNPYQDYSTIPFDDLL